MHKGHINLPNLEKTADICLLSVLVVSAINTTLANTSATRVLQFGSHVGRDLVLVQPIGCINVNRSDEKTECPMDSTVGDMYPLHLR